MLGQDMVHILRARDEDVTAADRTTADVTDAASMVDLVAGFDVVVNCAAWTAVDDAEEAEPLAFDVNAVGAAHLARATKLAGARLIQVSTDYVFSGDANHPYGEDADLRPKSAYGRTKAAGEWAVQANTDDFLIVRTAWLYGAHGDCFPKTMVKLLGARDAITVVDDQIGQPTWTVDLADLIVRLVEAGAPSGIYHGTSSGAGSWYDFARLAVEAAGLEPARVSPTTSAAFVRPAPRPAYSVLGHDRLRTIGVEPIGDWRERWAAAADAVLAGS